MSWSLGDSLIVSSSLPTSDSEIRFIYQLKILNREVGSNNGRNVRNSSNLVNNPELISKCRKTVMAALGNIQGTRNMGVFSY